MACEECLHHKSMSEERLRVIRRAHETLDEAYPAVFPETATLHDKIMYLINELTRYEQEAHDSYAGDWEDD